MALAFGLQGAGFTPDEPGDTATITLDVAGGRRHHQFASGAEGQDSRYHQRKIPGAGQRRRTANCPVSRVLKAEITLDATLV
jgi:osmotically inducible protein OsmC